VSYSLANPQAVEKHASAVLRSAPVTTTGGKEGDTQEKGGTNLLSLREKVSCPLLSCLFFPTVRRRP
jgi:hypothetical protein